MRASAYTGGGMSSPERLAGPRTVLFDDLRRLPDLLAAAGAGDARHTRERLRPGHRMCFCINTTIHT
jgi:hypothetical protein